MIERIAMRAAEFVGGTMGRAAGAAGDVVGLQSSPKPRHRLVKLALPAVAATAAAVAAAGHPRKPQPRPQTPTKRKSASNGTADKTRDELYELAKKAGVPGRSQMTKDELAKALAK